MSTVTKQEVEAEQVARLAANVARTAEAIERFIHRKLHSPVTVADLVAFARDPATLTQGVDFDSIKHMRESYDELLGLVGAEARVSDPTQFGVVPVSYLGERVAQVEAAAAPFVALRRRTK
jgi:hypothetical protein